MRTTIYKTPFWVRADELESWREFEFWMVNKCAVTPLDFAHATLFEKLMLMNAYFGYNPGASEAFEEMAADLKKFSTKMAGVLNRSPQLSKLFDGAKLAYDKGQLTKEGKETGAP